MSSATPPTPPTPSPASPPALPAPPLAGELLDPREEQEIDRQLGQLTRRCERILGVEELRAKMRQAKRAGRPLRIKMGMDPTAPDVTLGHAVPLSVIRQFQEWGHKAVLIIGDYTARVGDPTGRNELRKVLSGEQIDANARTYVAQIGKILRTDPDHLEIRWNSEWLGKMDLLALIKLLGRKTVEQLLARDDFAQRFAGRVPIFLHELAYPLLQGWDSVMIRADVEMGGSDQLFNNLVGREFQKEEGQGQQVVIVTPLLVGTDGVVKMSKSKGNYIGVTDPPGGEKGMFGKVMSLPDALMDSYYQLLTDVPEEEYKPLIAAKPRDAKVKLAKHVIAWLHNAEAADAAEAAFVKQFVRHEVPEDIPEIEIEAGKTRLPPVLVLAGLASSNSEGIRKIKEGAVAVDGEKVADPQKEWEWAAAFVLKLGRKYARVRVRAREG